MTAHHAGRPPGDSSQRLEILLADYQACREDDRVNLATLVAVFGVFVTLIGLMAAAVTQTCQFKPKPCIATPDFILAATPLIPAALLAYGAMLGVAAALRSYYMRGLEEEIREHVSAPITSLGDIMPASYMGITTEVVSLRRGRLPYRLLANLIVVVVIVVFGGYTAYVGFHVGHAEQIVMIIAYATVAILLVWQVSQGTVGGRAFFERAAQDFLNNREGTALPRVHAGTSLKRPRQKPSLIAYLIFPRPEDWIKWLIAPGIFLAAAWSSDSFARWPTFIALWLILEYLIYAARYQWNDIRGVEEDPQHSERGARRRLPVGSTARIRRNVLASLTVAVGRLLAAVLVGKALGLIKPVLTLMALVFAIAIVYEGLRSVRPSAPLTRPTPTVVAIWCIAGLGYGVRAGLGFVAGGLPITNSLTWIGISCFVFFGIMFVLLTWVLEAASSCYIDNNGAWRTKGEAALKAHLIALLRYVPIPLTGTQKPQAAGHSRGRRRRVYSVQADGSQQRILIPRGRMTTPWNLALAISATLGGSLGLGLAHATPSYASEIITITFSLVAGGLLAACNSQRMRLTIAGSAAVVLFGAITLFGVWPYTLLAAGPWLTVALLYFFFRGSSYRDLKEFGPHLLETISSSRKALGLGPILLYIVIGKRAWRKGKFEPESPLHRTRKAPV